MNILPSSEVRDKMSSILQAVEATGEPVYVTQYGKPKAVLVNYELYNQLMQEIEDLEDIRDAIESMKRPGRPFEEYLKEKEARNV